MNERQSLGTLPVYIQQLTEEMRVCGQIDAPPSFFVCGEGEKSWETWTSYGTCGTWICQIQSYRTDYDSPDYGHSHVTCVVLNDVNGCSFSPPFSPPFRGPCLFPCRACSCDFLFSSCRDKTP